MSVCANKPEAPGFDRTGCSPCVCESDVIAEMADEQATEEA